VAAVYQPLAAHLVIDTVDDHLAPAVSAAGMTPHVTNTMMTAIDITTALAEFTIATVDPTASRSV
jgi:hypothetical protein